MNLRLRSPSLNLAVIALLAMGQVVKCQESYPVPTFTLDELQRGTRDKSLKRTLTSNGLLAIRVPSNDQHQDLLSGLCRCRDNREIHGGDKILLADGLTTRSTIATATMGTDRPLPLPEDDITKQCGAGTYQSLERARDYVSQAASDAFMPALDRLIESSSSEGMASNEALLTKKNGYGYSSISAIVEEAVNLEHFHSYSKKNDGASDEEAPVDDALDWHTDGGLFIAFLPAKSCNDDGKDDDSFRLKMHGSSTEVKAVFPQTQEGEVIVAIMLGAGAEHWLHTPDSLQLRATRHAVKMSSGDERVWYGMMHLVPAAAIVQTVPKVLTFAEFKETATHSAGRRFGDDKSHPDNIVVGCGVHDDSHSLLSSNNYSAPRRRRLQHVGGPEDCSNSDNFYCWLSCLDVPDDGQTVDEHVEDNESLYCLDPAILADTKDIQKAVAACASSVTGAAGGVSNHSCGNYWYQTTGGIQSYTQSNQNDLSKQYCYGKSSMFMQGFEWEGTTCVVYLFSSWVITTRAALFAACLGTIAFGILVEFIIRQRRTILGKIEKGRKKMAWSAFLYAAQLSCSYLVMLIVMTYSGPLFISVISGLVGGHIVFNWANVVGKNGSGEVPLEGSTPCCQNVLDDVAFEGKANSSRTSIDKADTVEECAC